MEKEIMHHTAENKSLGFNSKYLKHFFYYFSYNLKFEKMSPREF